jgi:hypothetical protein
VADGERDDETLVTGVERQQRRGRPGWRKAVAVEPSPGDLPIGGPWEQPLVERNGAGGASERIGDGVLPSGLSA